MRKIFILLFCSLCLQASVYSQTITGLVKGSAVDQSGKYVSGATVSLLRLKDSSLMKMAITDKIGEFSFEKIALGSYRISITAVGHEKLLTDIINLNENNNAITLQPSELIAVAKTNAGVTVVARKPLIEQKPGKMVMNVDASPTNSGMNVLELLEKAPGVSVDNDGNISVKGKQGVTVLIDGRPTYLSGPDLASLLRTMQSNNLDQLEIMTNPPAKYDASGNSGIINIKTKKSVIKGMNGNTNLSWTQDKYPKFNGGLNLNYRNNKFNVFGGYNAGTYKSFNRLIISRRFYDDGIIAGSSDQVTRRTSDGAYQNVKAGVDYSVSKKTIIGVVLNGNFNNNQEDPQSVSNIRDANNTITSRLRSWSNNKRSFQSFTGNANYKHSFDSTGREVTADLDYAAYNNDNRTLLQTKSYDKDDNDKLYNVSLRGIIPSTINIYSAKVDYVQPFRSGLKLEAGLKSSYVKTDNEVTYDRDGGTGFVRDDRSNHFIYNENINAAYAIFSKSVKKWELTAGLRLENTVSKGHQLRNDSTSKRNYTNLFPNGGIGYNMNENNQFNFSYSRRVRRPDYESLNPFTFFLDSLTYGQGNPYLQPQFTNNFEFGHTFHKFLNTTINYSRTTDIITDLLKQDTEKKLTFQTKENFSSMNQIGLAIMANFNIRKWWATNIYTNVFNNHYQGLYNLEPVDIQFTSFQGNMTNTFTLGKGWSGEISGWYRSKSAEGLLISYPMWAANAAIAKPVLKKKGTLKLGIRDIFWTQQFKGYAKYADVDVDVANRRYSRQMNLSFTYRFGKTNIAPARRKSNGASDEQQRVGGGNN